MRTFTTLLALTALPLLAAAQVGVNNNNPEQALDVGGKIKLTDDATAPTEGTLRYNGSAADFEGYDGVDWKSLTASGPVPPGAIPVYGGIIPAVPGTNEDIIFSSWEGGFSSTAVPTGKLLVVNYVSVALQLPSFNNDRFTTFVRLISSGSVPTGLRAYAGDGSIVEFRSDPAPLFVVRPGERLNVDNGNASSGRVRIAIRGFLVDDLSY